MMNRISAFVAPLLCLLAASPVASGPLAKEIEVNGVRLPIIEQGAGEPIVFVHGAFSDLRAWEPIREEISKRYRFISYTQRYLGIGPWPDAGKNFSVATDAADLVKLIASLDAGGVHLVGLSWGGAIAAAAALNDPSLVRTLTLHEPALPSVLSPDSEEGKAASEDRKRFVGPNIAAAAKAGNHVQAVQLFWEGVMQLGPGGFDRLPQPVKTMVLDNARTIPLLLGSSPAPITCDMLKTLKIPTLITHGEQTQAYYKLVNQGVSKCIPGARQTGFPNLVHDAPIRDPETFATALFEFLARK